MKELEGLLLSKGEKLPETSGRVLQSEQQSAQSGQADTQVRSARSAQAPLSQLHTALLQLHLSGQGLLCRCRLLLCPMLLWSAAQRRLACSCPC